MAAVSSYRSRDLGGVSDSPVNTRGFSNGIALNPHTNELNIAKRQAAMLLWKKSDLFQIDQGQSHLEAFRRSNR